ncbi:MAG TPA: archease [Thermoplasmata archaeon]
MRYEELDHTADAGIRAYGATLEELFENAAAGLFSLITDLEKVRAVGEVKVRVQADDLGSLMVNWLSELLFLHETQHLLLCEFDVTLNGLRLQGRARGERIDKRRHTLNLVVKAVTYHGLKVDPTKGVAEVIFDI